MVQASLFWREHMSASSALLRSSSDRWAVTTISSSEVMTFGGAAGAFVDVEEEGEEVESEMVIFSTADVTLDLSSVNWKEERKAGKRNEG